MDWQPIETAPKSGLQRLLVVRDGRIEFAHWAVMFDDDGKPSGGWWWTDRLIKDREPQPTHWMPLPPAPTSPSRQPGE